MKNPLGEKIPFPQRFDASLLFAIPRSESRSKLRLDGRPPFEGSDLWRCYELSWLNANGVPQVGVATIDVPATSSHIIESKSLKLFLGSLNGERFASPDKLREDLALHLGRVLKSSNLAIEILTPDRWNKLAVRAPFGESLDSEELVLARVEYSPKLLRAGTEIVSESLYSDLLRSLCPVTGQPDYATLSINYRGLRIDRRSLLSYVVSLRAHRGFHEDLSELIFVDILRELRPEQLSVQCNFTRRGGIEINPVRTTPGFNLSQIERYVRQ